MTDRFKREQSFLLEDCFKEREGPFSHQADLDWEYILKESVRHGVAPILYDALREDPKIPRSVSRTLGAHYYGTASKNLHLMQEAAEIIGSLKEGGIKTIPIKGVALAERVYTNMALRPFEDIDLLITKSDFSQAKEILEDLGYQTPRYLLPDRFYLDHHFHLPFIKAKPKNVYLELHWDFTDRYMLFTPDMDAVWARASKVLHPEDELVYLAMHLEKHGYLNKLFFKKNEKEAVAFVFNPLSGNRLIWFVDLWLFLNHFKNRLNWENISEMSEKWGAGETLGSALFLLEALSAQRDLTPFPFNQKGRLTLTEKFLYRAAFGEKGSAIPASLLKMDSKTQFRPIRILDLLSYLFPPGEYLKRYYHYRQPLAVLFYRGYHLMRCSIRDLFRPLIVILMVLIKKGSLRAGRVLGKGQAII